MKVHNKSEIANIVDELYDINCHKLTFYNCNQAYSVNLKQRNLLLTQKKIIIENDPLCFPKKIIETIKIDSNLFSNLNVKKRKIMLYFKKENSNFSYIDDYEFSIYVLLIKKLIDNNNLRNFNEVDFIVKDNNYPTFLECSNTEDPEILGTYEFEKRMNVYANPVILCGQSVHSNKFFTVPICGKNIYIKKISKKLKKYVKFPVLYIPYANSTKIEIDTVDRIQLIDGSKVNYKQIKNLYSDFVSIKYTIQEKASFFIDCILEIDKTPLYYDCT